MGPSKLHIAIWLGVSTAAWHSFTHGPWIDSARHQSRPNNPAIAIAATAGQANLFHCSALLRENADWEITVSEDRAFLSAGNDK